MDHSKMQGMDGMQGMDHSKMPGMEPKQPPATAPSPQSKEMQGMDQKKKNPPHNPSPNKEMPEMDHSKMPGMNAQPSASPPSKEALEMEMKKTSDEMKKLSDELKAKSDAAKADKKTGDKSAASESSPAAAVYTCTMHPEVKSDKPGNCPKCGMKLVPRSAK